MDAIRNLFAVGHLTTTPGAIAALLLAIAVPTGIASAQPNEPPEITVYHSRDSGGADPRPEAPPGCDVVAETLVELGFDELADGDSVETQYPGVTFTTVPGGEMVVVTTGAAFPTSQPNVIGASFEGFVDGELDFFADFAPAVDNLQFTVVGDDDSDSGLLTVFFGNEESAVMTIPTDSDSETVHRMDLSAYADVTRISVTSITDVAGFGYDDFTWGQGEAIDCVIKGGPNETLDLWIDGGPTPSNVVGGETICKKDEAGMPGGGGDELCGAQLIFQLVGFGKFTEFVTAPGMDTLVLGEACDSGTPPSCVFQTNTSIKDLQMNFLSGSSAPDNGQRRLGQLILDSTGLDTSDPNSKTEINVQGAAAGAKLQLREFPLVEPNEIVAAIPVPEPGRFVQLLTGVFALAGLRRLRRQR